MTAELWWVAFDIALTVAWVTLTLLGVVGAYLALTRRIRPRIVHVTEYICCCPPLDDFEAWAAELDEDDTPPAVVTVLPASDEQLLDVAEHAGVVNR